MVEGERDELAGLQRLMLPYFDGPILGSCRNARPIGTPVQGIDFIGMTRQRGPGPFP